MQTYETPDPIAVSVELAGGRLTVRAGDRTDTVVDIVPTDPGNDADVRAAEQAKVDYAHGQLLVKAPKNKLRSLFGRPASIDITVDVPTGSSLEANVWAEIRSEGQLGDCAVTTAAGAVRLDETGRLRAKSAAGDVSVARAADAADVTTASGKIRLNEVDGPVVARTSNGDITLGDVTGDVRANTANGDIAVARAGATVVAKTAMGSVRVGEVCRGTVVLETAFGEVEVGIREGTAAWIDATSGFGAVRSELTASDKPSATEESVEVRARTGYGDIAIRRSAA